MMLRDLEEPRFANFPEWMSEADKLLLSTLNFSNGLPSEVAPTVLAGFLLQAFLSN
jgi:hypothetical protein